MLLSRGSGHVVPDHTDDNGERVPEAPVNAEGLD
jgi:hypothetical protein